MAQFTVDSWRQCALGVLVAFLAACGNQSAAPPLTDASAQPSTPTSGPATTTAPSPSPAKDATVAELLGGPDSQQPAPPDQSAPAQQRPPNQVGENTAAAMPEGVEGQFARVVSVAPVTGPHQVCTDETVTEQRKPNDEHQVAGTVIGAIAGGVIGHQIGGGRGRTLATVGGAVGGGVVGKEVQKNHQGRDTVTHVVKRCHTVDASAAATPVYDVVYAYQGQNFHVRLDHDPGDRLALPVRGIVNE
jgi:uncharacterized protein YcfJ